MNHLRLNLAFIGALVVLTSLGVGVVWSGRPEVLAFKQPRAVTTARLPIHFEPWDAQTGEPAHFTARGPGYSVLLSPTRMTMNLAGPSRGSGGTVEMEIVGGNQHAKAEGLDRLPGKSNYYIGNDPGKWRRDVPHFARVRFDDVYPGIDVVYYDARRERGGGPARQLEYDFIVEPGADPRRIELQFQGTEEISLEPDGGLRLRTASGEVRQERPVVYQEIAHARSPVEGRYVRSGAVGVAFEVGPYDRSRPLVVDPKVEYSTYLGGSGDDQAFGIAVGPDGSVYVVGWTESADFPAGSSPALTGSGNSPQQGRPGTGRDAFLTRFDNSLSESLVQNFFGGNNTDQAFDVVVDRDGNAYITGFTDSRSFPKTDDSTWAGGRDAFTVVVDPDGGLLHAGTLGGFRDEGGAGIDVLPFDEDMLVLTGGRTNSRNFPVTEDAFQLEFAGGESDGYVNVLRLDTTVGTPFAVDNRSTSFVGGNGTDFVDSLSFSKFSINVGFRFDENDVFAAMTTDSDNMAEFGVPHPTRAGGTDGHVTVLRLDPTFAPAWPPAGDEVAFSTYLPGGTGDESEVSFEIAESSLGGPRNKDKVYFFYSARSDDVPTSEGVVMENYPGGPQSLVVSVMEFNRETGEVEFRTTYAGGDNFDQASRMAVDPNGAPAVVGLTFSRIPTTPDAVFPNLNGVFGGYLTIFSPDFTEIDYSTYMWGNRNSNVTDVTFDPLGQIHLTGINGPGALVTPGSFQPDFGGLPYDATVAVIARATLGAVVNGTFTGPVSAGTLVTAFGTKIGPKNFVFSGITPEGTLEENVGGVEVLVTREDSSVLNAKVLNASSFQTTFLLPIGLRVGEKVSIQIVYEDLKSSPLEVTIEEPDVAWWSFPDGTGIVQKIDPETGAFSIVGPDNALGPGGIGVAWGQYGGETVPPCPGDGVIVNPTGDPLYHFENREFEFSLLTGMDEDGSLTFETIFVIDPLFFGTGPGLLCPVVQGVFIGPPEEVLLDDAGIEALFKSWVFTNATGRTPAENVELARQNVRDNKGKPEEEKKEPVLSEEDLRKAIEIFNDDTVFDEKSIGLVSERFGILEPLPPARGTYFFDEFESFR